jgi:L,D-peptidoglycan transpeptidase YkuD (ErfK/YbiS/YcfS/YnhG family)
MHRTGARLVLALAVVLLSVGLVTPGVAQAADVTVGQSLSAGGQLTSGQQLVSANGRYRVVMQGDGNLVVYGPAGPDWASGTGVRGTRLVMQGDGNLVGYGPDGRAVWHTSTGTNPGARVVMQDDGNLVVYGARGNAVWASRSASTPAAATNQLSPGGRLGPGQQLVSAAGRFRLVMQTDGNLVLYGATGPVTASGTGVPGTYLVMQGDGNVVAYSPGGGAVWSTGSGDAGRSRLVVQDDGNVVVYRADGVGVWASSGGLPLPVNTLSAKQVVTVVASSATATEARLTTWVRGAGGRWTPTISPVRARVGAAGIGNAHEGSTKTPAGTFTLTEAFGRAANPGARLPYRVVDRQDWWVSDVNSPQYNQHVRCAAGSCPFNEAAGENLYAQGAVYDHAVVIDYNRAGTPGAGSAFFLHVSNGSATAGCVSIDRSTLVSVLRWLDPQAKPLIAIGVG